LTTPYSSPRISRKEIKGIERNKQEIERNKQEIEGDKQEINKKSEKTDYSTFKTALQPVLLGTLLIHSSRLILITSSHPIAEMDLYLYQYKLLSGAGYILPLYSKVLY
jgi:hypothetical protein